jgi:hypothetical protein
MRSLKRNGAARCRFALIVHDGDAIGIQRHELVVAIAARLSLIVRGLFFAAALCDLFVRPIVSYSWRECHQPCGLGRRRRKSSRSWSSRSSSRA